MIVSHVRSDAGHVFLWEHSLSGLVSVYVGCTRPDDISGMLLHSRLLLSERIFESMKNNRKGA